MSDLAECVLVVDDEVMIAELWCMVAEDMGLKVCGRASTADAAVALARAHRPRVVLMDVRLPGGRDGVDAAMAIHRLMKSRIIFITGSKDPSTVARIALGDPAAVLFKPVAEWQVRTALEAAML